MALLNLNSTAQVSVGSSTPTQVIGLNTSRAAVIVTNTSSSVAVYLGNASVTASTGHYLGPGNPISIPVTCPLFAITASGSAVVTFMEIE
jgi:hypothetical protein